MSQQASHFKLGLFVLIGTALILGFVVVLGAGALFEKRVYLETYFDESVQGLSVGSPVKYRGVTIGTVDEISLCRQVFDLDPLSQTAQQCGRWVYVLISLVESPRIREAKDKDAAIRQQLDVMTSGGLRVRLASQGITGLAYIEADYLDPDANPLLSHPWTPRHPYVPSAPSTMTRVTDSIVSILADLGSVDFDAIGANLDKLLQTVDRAVDDADVSELSTQLADLLKNVDQFVSSPETQSLKTDLSKTAADVRQLVEESRPQLERLVGSIEKGMGRLLVLLERPELEEAMAELPASIAQLRLSLKQLNETLGSNRVEIDALVANLRAVTENLKEISSNAKKYPSHLLFGEPPSPTSMESRSTETEK